MEFDFETNAAVEDVNTVPEQFRGLYVEVVEGDDKGKFVLGDFAKGVVEAYTGTNRSLTKARSDKKTSSDESAQRRIALQSFETILDDLGLDEDSRTADGLKAKIAELVAAAKNGKELQISMDNLKKEYERKHAEVVDAKDAEISGLRSDIHKTKISDVATGAITDAGGAVDLLKPMIESQCKVINEDGKYVVRVVGENGEPRPNGKGGYMGVADLVAELKLNDKYARAFDSETLSGGGTKPGIGARTSLNTGEELTSVQKIVKGLSKGQHIDGRGRAM